VHPESTQVGSPDPRVECEPGTSSVPLYERILRAYCIADEDTVRGFRLAGVPGRSVSTPMEGAEVLAWAMEQPDYGLLILTEDVMASLGPQLEVLRMERNRPLLVEIPGPAGPKAERESLRQLVQRAVGTSLEKES
jgi:vacuolar-type H+-ATPase subunit F/Vma7